jgi:hypothetical protein
VLNAKSILVSLSVVMTERLGLIRREILVNFQLIQEWESSLIITSSASLTHH